MSYKVSPIMPAPLKDQPEDNAHHKQSREKTSFGPKIKPVPETVSIEAGENVAAGFPTLLVEAEKLAHTMMSGYHGRKRAGTGETFWQHRPYIFGDSVSQIDWRQSARADERLFIRQNEWEAAASVWLWRDPSHSMVYSSDVNGGMGLKRGLKTVLQEGHNNGPFETVQKRTRATILATALSILLSQSGERIGVLGHEGRFYGQSRLFSGRGAPARVLESLDHSISEEKLEIPLNHGVKAGSQIVLLSDFFMEASHLKKAIEYYSRQGVRGVLCQVLDPAERDFPFRGRTEFWDTETSDRLLFGNAGSVRQSYQEKFKQHQADLKKISQKSGWPLITHYTQKPAQDALMLLHQALSEKKAGAL